MLNNAAHNEFDNVVIIQSCDNDFFRFSRDNLAVHSEGFEGASAISSSTSISAPETICLTESSATLRLLLQFMSSRPQPDLSKASFRDLANVSEAAEKYQVYAALPPCKAHMARALPQHPFPVMAYAARHGYMSLANEAAELVVAMPYEAILAKLASLPMDCGVAWVRGSGRAAVLTHKDRSSAEPYNRAAIVNAGC
ncbi:hypothetical protein PLICRDRAFT_116383 [Plicaturopsis crispa FD-325 SS-3]|uniref:BTB domain-containing protein n=1 Tax=Plicaturopsis crispa FD-325 SS-3 TaxID=944288 RepID=A0A0C9SS19_PLICR|nr:hypothetical protein PLICRDRAFT_116383 [Plicaturopsis crispa FD-325 SS-3]